MSRAVVLSAVRTPIGRYGGALSGVRPDDLAGTAIAAAVDRAGIDPAAVEDVFFGCANQAGEDNRNVARMGALLAGLPEAVAGVTVNRLCASGLSAVVAACHAVAAGDGDLFVAGGVESMSRAPLVMAEARPCVPARQPGRLGHDARLALSEPARWRSCSRSSRWARRVRTWPSATGCRARNRTHSRSVRSGDGPPRTRRAASTTSSSLSSGVERDEHPGPTRARRRSPRSSRRFAHGGTVTAGNSSGINDGAAALVIASEERARELGADPLGTFRASAVAGVDPRLMGVGPIPAVRKALARAGIDVADLDLVELNEAFASQSVAVIRELGLDPERVNVNGGAIAVGHPLGMSGARLVVTLLHELRRRGGRYGLATLCVGVGQGQAAVFERAPR